MKSDEVAMALGHVHLTILITSLATLVAFIVVILLCTCCRRPKTVDSDDEEDVLYPVTDYRSVSQGDPVADRDDVKKLHRHPPASLQTERTPATASPHFTRKTIKFERPAEKRFVTETVQPDQFSPSSSLNRSLGISGSPGQRGDAVTTTQPTSRVSGQSSQSFSSSPSLLARIGSAGVLAAAAGGSPSADGFGSSQSSPALSTRMKYGLTNHFSSRGSDGAGSANSSPFHKVLSGNHDVGGAVGDDLPQPGDEPDYFTGGEKLGKLQFSLNYDFQEMTLTLRIIRAIELPAKDFSGTSDPYVKILLLPDKKHKLTTNIKRRNLNPRWNEMFAFEGFPYSKLMNRTLYLQVLDYDRFSRDDPIGEVCLPLSDVDLAQGQTLWRSLAPCKGHAGKLGELLMSMCYQPTVGRITIVIIKARDLKAKDINGLSDPYVKIWLCHDGKKVEKKKTSIKEKNLNPVFNESFIFNVPYERIRQTSLHISCMDYDRLGRNELIGQIILGSKSGPMEVKHWNEMFAKSRQPVAQWHILKDFG